jgi:hypothetical protein
MPENKPDTPLVRTFFVISGPGLVPDDDFSD